jgi:hypothetical protein
VSLLGKRRAVEYRVFDLGHSTFGLHDSLEPPDLVGIATLRGGTGSLMEVRIRELCSLLLSTNDPDTIDMIGEQLRCAIHDHVEELRHHVNDLPIVTSMLKAS